MSDINDLDLTTPENLTRFMTYFKEKFGRIAFSLVVDPAIKITPTTSRIGGLPYWHFSRPYPCNKNNEALRFMCQINLADLPDYQHLMSEHQLSKDADVAANALPKQGLLQFFAAPSDTYGCTFEQENDDFCIVYWPSLGDTDTSSSAPATPENQAASADTTNTADSTNTAAPADNTNSNSTELNLTMEELRTRLAEHGLDEQRISNLFAKGSDYSWPIDNESALRLVAGISLPHMGDSENFDDCLEESLQAAFDLPIDEEEIDNDVLFGFMDQLSDSDNYSQQINQLLGLSEADENKAAGTLLGYPDFTQDNPLSYNGNLVGFDTLLLCLDTVYTPKNKAKNNFEMMWGDCGIADIFINLEKLNALDFSDPFYTWDCC